MCDASIPLTTEEWEEWGNPHEPRYRDYMLSYSPMDNVQPGATYPALLIAAGLNDPRVAACGRRRPGCATARLASPGLLAAGSPGSWLRYALGTSSGAARGL